MADLTLASTFAELIKKVNENSKASGNSSSSLGGCSLLIAKTAEEMEALKTDENVGKVALYIGTSTDKYRKGARYLIENASSELGSFVLGESTLWAE